MLVTSKTVSSNETGSSPKIKLDFRFADEDDAKEIAKVVNEAYQFEADIQSEFYFRKSENKVEADDVRISLNYSTGLAGPKLFLNYLIFVAFESM